jgi:archaellum component FlaC
MSIAKCVVRLKDYHDTVNEAVVYAESLYEAVLRGLNRLVDVGWESDTGETIRQVEVEIYQEPIRHVVNVLKLLEWVKRDTHRPGEQTRKDKLRKLLGTR